MKKPMIFIGVVLSLLVSALPFIILARVLWDLWFNQVSNETFALMGLLVIGTLISIETKLSSIQSQIDPYHLHLHLPEKAVNHSRLGKTIKKVAKGK